MSHDKRTCTEVSTWHVQFPLIQQCRLQATWWLAQWYVWWADGQLNFSYDGLFCFLAALGKAVVPDAVNCRCSRPLPGFSVWRASLRYGPFRFMESSESYRERLFMGIGRGTVSRSAFLPSLLGRECSLPLVLCAIHWPWRTYTRRLALILSGSTYATRQSGKASSTPFFPRCMRRPCLQS